MMQLMAHTVCAIPCSEWFQGKGSLPVLRKFMETLQTNAPNNIRILMTLNREVNDILFDGTDWLLFEKVFCSIKFGQCLNFVLNDRVSFKAW